MRHCPSPCSARRYWGLISPSVQDMSHSTNLGGWERREWTERIHGLGYRGYYLSGHGSLHIFHGCPRGVFSQLLADRIHLENLWVIVLFNCWETNEITNKLDLTGHHNTPNINLHLVQLGLSQNLWKNTSTETLTDNQTVVRQVLLAWNWVSMADV